MILCPRHFAPARHRLCASSLLLLVFAAGCAKPQNAQGPPPPVPVRVATVLQKTVPVQIHAIGNVEAYSTVAIKSQVTGPLLTVHFHEGQDVTKGDLLFEIDKRPFEVALQQAQANLARDQARAENSKLQEQRAEKLFAAGVIPREQFDQAHAQADADTATVRADEAAIAQARLNLEYCEIRAPIDARAGRLLVYAGNQIKANDDTGMVQLNQIIPIYANFAVPEQYLSDIKKYRAAGTLRVTAAPADAPDLAEQGTLSFIDNQVDPATGTIRLKGTFANPQRRLWPGQFVNVTLTMSERPNAIIVPATALQVGQTGQFVFVVRQDMTVESRPVTAGQTVEGMTIIEKGLQAGETVVTDGQLRLIPNSRVKILSGAAGGGASGTAAP